MLLAEKKRGLEGPLGFQQPAFEFCGCELQSPRELGHGLQHQLSVALELARCPLQRAPARVLVLRDSLQNNLALAPTFPSLLFWAWPPLQSLAVKKETFFLCKFWPVKNF